MAELLLADGWPAPDSPVVYLHEALSSDYIVVADPVVRQHELDGVVVGPQGLFVLYVDGPGGEVCPEQNGVQVGPVQPGRATPHPRPVGQAPNALRTFLQDEFGGGRLAVHRKTVGTGRAALHPSPPEEVRQATSALRAFLQDEFPGLQPAIHHLLICTGPDADAAGAGTAERAAMTTEAAPDAITSTELPDGSPLLDPELREALAVAVRDRRLTASQRATEPFIFRSGGQKAWTLREVVAHMDRHPDDGVYHLRNGTLARWLSEQGAVHLAELARAVMGQREVDARVPLETFLIGTGLLPRPSLSIHPPRLDFGYILAGETAARRLRVQKAAGRGYLFGAVRSGDSWLHANPESFSGGALDAVVSVDSEALLISDRPYETALFIESTASDEPVSVPIRFRIMGMPSRLNRFLVRPLAGVLVAGLPGTAIGWLLGLLLVWMGAGLSGSALSPAVGAAAAGLLWGVMGGIRGLFQPPAWPVHYATRRWLTRTGLWSLAVVGLAVVATWLSRQLSTGPAGASGASLVLLALALAIIPSVLGEVRAGRIEAAGPRPAVPVRRWPRPAALLRAVLLGIVLVAGVGLLGPAAQQFREGGTAATVQQWVVTQGTRLESGLNEFIDGLYLRRYDRRAPAKPAPAAPSAPTR